MRVVVTTKPAIATNAALLLGRARREARCMMTPTWPITRRRTARITVAFIGGAAAQLVTRLADAGAEHELDYYTAARGYTARGRHT